MRHVPALLLLATLTACTADDKRYPSLLPRPIESQSMAEPERPPVAAAPDPALDKRIAEITGTLDAATRDFATAAQNAEALIAVARGVPVGSEAWLDAQAALSAAEAKQAPAASAVADLDRLSIDRGAGGKAPYPALDAAVERADAILQQQVARLASLDAALASP
jgi:hypothetical protein